MQLDFSKLVAIGLSHRGSHRIRAMSLELFKLFEGITAYQSLVDNFLIVSQSTSEAAYNGQQCLPSAAA